MYICGFDPGYVALGTAFMDETTRVADISVVNLEIWKDGQKHPLRERDMNSVLHDYLTSLDRFFRNTRIVCIERQPGIGAAKVRAMGTLLESQITARYPDIEVFVVSPVSVKKFFAIAEAAYDARKEMCMETGVIRPADMPAVRTKFTRTTVVNGSLRSEFKVDGVEAGMLCLYIAANLEKERKLKVARNVGFHADTLRVHLVQPVVTKEMRAAAVIRRKRLSESKRVGKKVKNNKLPKMPRALARKKVITK